MLRLSTRNHGALDYALGAALIALPWALGYTVGGTPMLLSTTIGVLIIVVNVLTNYEYGLMPMVPMGANLGFDFGIGLFLIATPLAFQFPPNAWIPLLTIGVIEMVSSAMTEMNPSRTFHMFGDDR